jgi:hypothetical protein
MNEKALQRWLDQELEVMVHVHEVRNEYEKQSQLLVFYLNFQWVQLTITFLAVELISEW